MSANRFLLGLSAGLALAVAAPAAEVRGRIVRVDLKKNELQLEARGRLRGRTLTLALDPRTQVLFGPQEGTLTDLESGRRARVVYEGRDGQEVAKVVRVFGRRPTRPAARPAGRPAARAADEVAGVLRRVALTDREIVVIGPGAKGPETETTVSVPEKVRITKGDKAIDFDTLREGEQVTVKVDKRAGRLVAVSVHVGPVAVQAAVRQKRDVIPRVRQALQMIDQVLEQIERARDRDKGP